MSEVNVFVMLAIFAKRYLLTNVLLFSEWYRGADKSLARPGRKQATATEYFDFYISYL
jgi:hypothetical protein